jgi:hypothetical protein
MSKTANVLMLKEEEIKKLTMLLSGIDIMEPTRNGELSTLTKLIRIHSVVVMMTSVSRSTSHSTSDQDWE